MTHSVDDISKLGQAIQVFLEEDMHSIESFFLHAQRPILAIWLALIEVSTVYESVVQAQVVWDVEPAVWDCMVTEVMMMFPP